MRMWQRRLTENRVYPLLILVITVNIALNPGFISDLSLRGLLTKAATSLIVVAGLAIVLICGQIDLSVGSTVALGTMVAIGWQPYVGSIGAGVLAVAVGALVGVVNGVLVSIFKVNSILATLGVMIVVNGVSLSFAAGGTVSGVDIEASLAIQQPIAAILTPASITAVLVVLVLHLLVSQTPWGRALYIIGGGDDDGRLSGLPTVRILISAFAVSGAAAALGGVILGIGLNTGSPLFGETVLFTVIAAAVVGGVSLYGAEGTVLGAAVGVLSLEAVINGMNLARITTDIQTIVNGAILLVVVLLDSYFGLRRRRRWSQRMIDLAPDASSHPQAPPTQGQTPT
jgi:ribose transport system permease protein